MNEQTRLFEVQPDHSLARPRGAWVPAIETPAARTTDPETSHEAAEGITASGVRSEQQIAVLRLVELYPGKTAGEIAKKAMARSLPWASGPLCALPTDEVRLYFTIQRRVSELEPQFVRRGEARVCSARGTKQTTLWPVEGAP